MKTLALFAHFDAGDAIAPYVEHHLRALRAIADRLVFVSTAALSPVTLARARSWCDRAFCVPNVGYDFAMWRAALADEAPAQYDRLLLTNSSIFGPLAPLRPLMARLDESADVWGLTDSRELQPHLQSYFLVFSRRALTSAVFARFWRDALPLADKAEVIRRYEVGLTEILRAGGLVTRALVEERTLPPLSLGSRVRRLSRCSNPTLTRPAELVAAGVPYVKVALLERNPARVALDRVYAQLAAAGFGAPLLTPRASRRLRG